MLPRVAHNKPNNNVTFITVLATLTDKAAMVEGPLSGVFLLIYFKTE